MEKQKRDRYKAPLRNRLGSLRALCGAVLLSLTMSTVQAASFIKDISIEVNQSDSGATKNEGLLLEAEPTYADFTGEDGLKLEISMPTSKKFDYTLMFWFRSKHNYVDLMNNAELENEKWYLFEMPGSGDDDGMASCYITRPTGKGLILKCTPDPDDTFQIDLEKLPDIQSWIHLTYAANYNPTSKKSSVKSNSYVRLDISSFTIEAVGGYASITKPYVMYGLGDGYVNEKGQKIDFKLGFPGNYRQFFLTLGYLKPEKVPLLKHQYKVLDYSTMGYYKMEQTVLLGRYDDAFRPQQARIVNVPPLFVTENVAAPFCNSISQQFYQVPQFYKSQGSKFADIDIPRFKFKGRNIGYTLSFWMKNFGQHSFSTSPLAGRQDNHMIKLDEVLALFYDSPTSFRVYVYAKDNMYETTSKSVFLPLNAWINIQVSIEQTRGITIMTFNQNGERQQLIQNKIFLGEQYPKGTISLFQSFIGIPWSLKVWEKFIELPVNENTQSSLVIDYDFRKEYFKNQAVSNFERFQGWKSRIEINGQDLPAVEGEGFDFIYENLPVDTDFKKPKTIGQLDATESQYDVTCPSPSKRKMYLEGDGAKFSMAILVEKTQQYTVEFWFRANLEQQAKLDEQDVTYLFMMAGAEGDENLTTQVAKNSMEIYVENKQLRCAPFGRPKDDDDTLKDVLIFGDINPFATDTWQHITCIFVKDRFVKGQYMAADTHFVYVEPVQEKVDEKTCPGYDDGLPVCPILDPILPPPDFQVRIIRPMTFGLAMQRELQNRNNQGQYRWNVILGNDENQSKYFAGSFKDVRLWKSARTDAELYSYRFNQVQIHPDLQGNLKFMDGNPYVKNAAITNSSGVQFANIEPDMQLLQADDSNIICATDTYFDYDSQTCTRYPYTSEPSLVYMVSNNVQHGHQMILEKISKSTMFLPGEQFQPKTRSTWSIPSDSVVQEKYLQDDTKNSYNFDPIFMGDGKKYNFKIDVVDVVNHNFFLDMSQEVVPRKCLRVIDSVNKEQKSKLQRRIIVPALTVADLIEERDTGVKAEIETNVCFTFEVQRIDGCADTFASRLEEKVLIKTQPPIDQAIIDMFKQTYSNEGEVQKFEVCIPEQKIPGNTPIDMIFYALWTSQANAQAFTQYINIIYQVTLISEIEIVYKTNLPEDQFLIDVTVDDLTQLVIDASGSYFKGNEVDGSKGLTYRWECTQGIAHYCDQWAGSPVIEIPYDIIDAANLINNNVNVTIVVFAIEASSSGKEFPLLEFKKNNIFKWSNTVKPRFTIDLPANNPKNVLLVSQTQLIEIIPDGYRTTDSGFRYSFKILEEDLLAKPISHDDDKSFILTIQPDTLKFQANYTLEVTVSNTLDSVTNQFPFRTGVQPKITTFTVSPLSGIMYKDEFDIILNNYESPNGPLKYTLFGVIKEPESEFQITSEPILLLEDSESINTQLPEVDALRVKIIDQVGEIATIETPVQVKKEEGKTWMEILTARLGNIPEKPMFILWQIFDSVGKQTNAAAANNEAEYEDVVSVNFRITKAAYTDIRKLNYDTTEPNDITVIRYIVSAIEAISKDNKFVGEEQVPLNSDGVPSDDKPGSIQMMVETLEYVQRFNPQSIALLNKDGETFAEIFTSALGNLMSLTAQRAQAYFVADKYYYSEDAKYDLNFQDNIVWNRLLQDNGAEEDEDLRRFLQDGETTPAADAVDESATDSASGSPTEDVAATEVSAVTDTVVSDDPNSEEIGALEPKPEAEELEPSADSLIEWNVSKELYAMRELMKKIIVIKNRQLDQLCETSNLDTPRRIQNDNLELSIFKIESTSNLPTKSFTNKAQTVNIDINVETIVKESHALSPGYEWVCIQNSFMKSNPVAGFSVNPQFYFEDSTYTQTSTIDNRGRRLIDRDGITKLDGKDFKIKFIMDLSEDNQTFYDGQTICAHYDGNGESFTGQLWDSTSCSFEYDRDSLPNSVTCTCSEVKNFYYAVITDRNLKEIKEIEPQNTTHNIILLVTIPLLIIGLVGPCIMVALDQHDYSQVEDNVYEVTRRTALTLQQVRHKLMVQEIYYKEKEISRYWKLSEFRSASFTALSTFHRTLHPYFSLFTKFDYSLKRMMRFYLVLGQWCAITLMLWFCYSTTFIEWTWTDIIIEFRSFYLSLILSIFTLPLPRKFLACLETKMYVLRGSEPGDDRDAGVQEQAEEPEMEAILDDDEENGNKDEMKPKKMPAVVWSEDIRPALIDRFIYFKLIFIVFAVIFWVFTIAIMFILTDWAGRDDEPRGGIDAYIELTPAQAQEFVLTWYLAIFVWGEVINELRIVVISLMAPIRATALFDALRAIYEEEGVEEADRRKKVDSFFDGFCAGCSCVTTFLIPSESVEIALDALFTIDIHWNPQKYGDMDVVKSVFDTQAPLTGAPGDAVQMTEMKKSARGLLSGDQSNTKDGDLANQSALNQSKMKSGRGKVKKEKGGKGGKGGKSKGSKKKNAQ